MIYQWQKETGKLQSRASKLEKKLEEEVGMEVKEKMQASEALKLKEEALADMKSHNQNRIAKECKSNDEL